MNWYTKLEEVVNNQGLMVEMESLPLNIYMRSGDILTNCFIENGDEKLVSIVETNAYGGEEVRILNQEDIAYIGVVYASPERQKTEKDAMFL